MGRVVHFEVGAEDLARARSFYRNVFDWDIVSWNGAIEYLLISTGKGDSNGIDGGIMPRAFGSSTIVTAEVEDLDRAMERIDRNGGEVLTERNFIPEVGMHCYCKDTEGNVFGILHPKRGDPIL
jgi:predicted enzyme related to lactoylglutathione lyase